MMSNLPADLLEEIFCKVPAMSVTPLRSTCKRWNTLFKDKRFTEKHFRKATKQSLILMLKKYRICSMSVNLNVAPPSIEFKGALSLKGSHSNSEKQVNIYDVFHCDGLLLCNTYDNRLVVWNPCLGETRWIHPKTSYKYSRFALGYQNNKSCRSYKILRYRDNNSLIDPVIECEIYEFSSASWRVLDVVLDCFIRRNGVSLKGNSYWLVLCDTNNKSLLCFDFTTESFTHLCLPPSRNDGCTSLSVVREEQLSMLHLSKELSKTEIWLTNKFDSETALLWSKFFTVDLNTHVISSLLMDEEKKVVLCFGDRCNLRRNKIYTIGEDDGYYAEIPSQTPNNPWGPIIFNYVPSLFQTQ